MIGFKCNSIGIKISPSFTCSCANFLNLQVIGGILTWVRDSPLLLELRRELFPISWYGLYVCFSITGFTKHKNPWSHYFVFLEFLNNYCTGDNLLDQSEDPVRALFPPKNSTRPALIPISAHINDTAHMILL